MQFLDAPIADRLGDALLSSLPFFSSSVDVDHVLVTVLGDTAAAPVVVAMARMTVVVVVLVTVDRVGVVAVAVAAVIVVIIGGIEMVPAPERGAVLAEMSDSRSASLGSEDCSSSPPYLTSTLMGAVHGRWIGIVGTGTGARCMPRPVCSRMLSGC